jgi:hypothetical protein
MVVDQWSTKEKNYSAEERERDEWMIEINAEEKTWEKELEKIQIPIMCRNDIVFILDSPSNMLYVLPSNIISFEVVALVFVEGENRISDLLIFIP